MRASFATCRTSSRVRAMPGSLGLEPLIGALVRDSPGLLGQRGTAKGRLEACSSRAALERRERVEAREAPGTRAQSGRAAAGVPRTRAERWLQAQETTP